MRPSLSHKSTVNSIFLCPWMKMLIKQPHRPSLSVVNNASTTERCGALSFSPQLRYTPRVVVCEPVRHTLRGRRVFNGTARGTLYNIRNERALQLSRKRRDRNGSYNQVESIRETHYVFWNFQKISVDARILVAMYATDSKVPSNFRRNAGWCRDRIIERYLLLGRVDSLWLLHSCWQFQLIYTSLFTPIYPLLILSIKTPVRIITRVYIRPAIFLYAFQFWRMST